MNVRRWIVLLLTVLLVAVGCPAGWLFTHDSYRNTVYYRQGTVTFSGSSAPPFQWQTWDDPEGHATWQVYSPMWCTVSWRVVRAACADGQSPPSPSSASPYWQPLQRNGYRAVGGAWLQARKGGVQRVVVQGWPALRFTMRWAGEQFEAWIDATTYVPLQVQWSVDAGPVVQRWTRTRTLPPGTLPRGFFSPVQARPAVWDRIAGWVRDRLERE